MSSHREAPEISKDPVADSTDLYAFVSPDRPGPVTIIANYIPLEAPDGGPNFYEFGDDVLYAINIDNDGDGDADISYQFQFTNEITDPDTFLYNTGPITSLQAATWNRRQTYSVTRVDWAGPRLLASEVPCPPCNIGPLSTPDYDDLAGQAITTIAPGTTVFAGQRAEGFYVDLGAVFDLGDSPTLRAGPHHVRPVQHRSRSDGCGRQLHRRRERAQHRLAGSHQRTDRRRAGTRGRRAIPRRSSGSGPPRAARGRGSSKAGTAAISIRVRSLRCPGWAILCSTRC